MKAFHKDPAALLVLAHRAWQAAAGAATLLLIAHWLTPVQQGYYYAMAGLAALHLALEMGFSSLLVQFAAREFPHLHWGPHGQVLGAPTARFLGVCRSAMFWFVGAAALFLLLFPLGAWYIAHDTHLPREAWIVPWLALVLATAVQLLCLPALAITEGSGGLREAYAMRLLQAVLGSLATWTGLLLGWGLMAIALAPLVTALTGIAWLLQRKRGLLAQLLSHVPALPIWRQEIWPLQWRGSAAWWSGYVLVTLHAPLLFRTQGAVAAGKMGLSMTVASMLSMLSLAWLIARIPEMTRLAQSGDWQRLDALSARVFRWSVASYLAGAAGALGLLALLQGGSLAERFVSLPQACALLLAMACYHMTALFSGFVRTHMRDPFLLLSLAGSGLTLAAALWAAPAWGISGVIGVLLAANALLFLPVTRSLWLRQKALRQEVA